MKKIILSSLIFLGINGGIQASGPDRSQADTTLKTYSVGARLVHLFDLPSYRYDTPLSPDMRGLTGSKTKVDFGFDIYAEKQFTPLFGAQLGFRYASITGAGAVEYYTNTFSQAYADAVFILSNLDFFHSNSPWNFYAKAGMGYGSFSAEQFLIEDDAPDSRMEDKFWEHHLGAGVQYEINSYLRLELEANYNLAHNDGFDGFDHGTGSDPYLTTALGVAYTFGSKEKKPMYATNYFGEDYVPVDMEPVAATPAEPEVKKDEMDALEGELLEQKARMAASLQKIKQQQQELEAIKEALKVSKNNEVVYFEFDSNRLSREAKMKLLERFGEMETDVQLALIAYADNSGDSNYNNQLKQRRAESVKRFLVENLGFADENINISKGEAQDLSPEDQFLNRKVLIKY